MKVHLGLIEEPPGARAFWRQQPAAVLEAPPRPARHRAEDVQVGQQRLRRRGFGTDGGARGVLGDPEHEQGIGQHQITRRLRAGDVHLIEPADLPGGESVRGDRLDEADAVGVVGARQRDEVFHRGVGREAAGPDRAVDRFGQIAHHREPARDPARGLVKPTRQIGEREPEAGLQRVERPALLERADGIRGAHELLEDQRLRFVDLPAQGPHRVLGQPDQRAQAFVAIDQNEPLVGGDHDDRELLAVLGERRQELALLVRIARAQRLVSAIELMTFEIHRPVPDWPRAWHGAERVLRGWPGMSPGISCRLNDVTHALVLRASGGKSAHFSCRVNDLPGLLVLRGPKQDSTEMAEKIGPHDAERVLRDIPRELGQRRRQRQRRDTRLGLLGVEAAALQAVRDEVVGITTTPGGLRPRAASDLTGRRRTRALATADAAVRHKPSATDAAGVGLRKVWTPAFRNLSPRSSLV